MKAHAYIVPALELLGRDSGYYCAITGYAVAYQSNGDLVLGNDGVSDVPVFPWAHVMDGTETPASLRTTFTTAIRAFYADATLTVIFPFDATGVLGL